MTTVAYPEMRDLARGIEKIFPSAVCSGIVGDRRHKTGYHRARRDVGARDYSVIRPDDKAGPDDGAAGVDITMNSRDMRLATARLANAYRNTSDPRRKYVNAVNGWDGTGPAIRYDFYARKSKPASPDHKWHLHVEIRRRYIRDRVAHAAVLSMLRGESVETWLRSRGIDRTSPAMKGATLKPPPYPGRVLKRDDRLKRPDPAVRQWQQRMRARGWTSIGKADGLPGKKFERVTRAWQKTIKLPATGKIDQRTWPTPWTRPLGH